MDRQNWRIETDAEDYFGSQKKQLSVSDRRPLIRKPSDLVGPGVAAYATRVTDLNDQLALYNGYYSGNLALNSPDDVGEFVGWTSMDASTGGVQIIYPLADWWDGAHFQRIVSRNPGDASSVSFGPWTVIQVEQVVRYYTAGFSTYSSVPSGADTVLSGVLTTVQTDSASLSFPSFSLLSGDTQLFIAHPGVYTIQSDVVCQDSIAFTLDVTVDGFSLGATAANSNGSKRMVVGIEGNAVVQVHVLQTTGSAHDFKYNLSVVREGDYSFGDF